MPKKKRVHTDTLFKVSNTLNIKDIYTLFCLKYFSNTAKQQILPPYLQTISPLNSEYHRYQISSSNNYRALTYNSLEMKKKIRYQIPAMVSKIPPEILPELLAKLKLTL